MSALIEVLKILVQLQGKHIKNGGKRRGRLSLMDAYKDGLYAGLLLALIALIVFLILYMVVRAF